jgi:hypothetical protein
MTGHFESDYDGSNIIHITIERTKSHGRKTIKYSLHLNKADNYELAFINAVFVKFIDKYVSDGFIGEFVGSIRLFDDVYEVVNSKVANFDYIRSILSAANTFFIFQTFSILELTFKEHYPKDNDWYLKSVLPDIFKMAPWTLSINNYY